MLDNMELKPYQYNESSFGGALTITARVILSETQYYKLGKLPKYVKVIRSGIDETPREMSLQEGAWSKSNNEIKEEIRLYDKEKKRRLPVLGWLHNLSSVAAEQSLIIDELLNIIILTGTIKDDQITAMRAKITEERVRDKVREFYYSKIDLDEFQSIEEWICILYF